MTYVPLCSSALNRSLVALLAAVAICTAGCAYDPEPLPGSDRRDDTCNKDAEYVQWLTTFKKSDEFKAIYGGTGTDLGTLSAQVDAKPCASGDDGYVAWFALFEHLFTERVKYERSGTGFDVENLSDYTLDASEELILDAILLARPKGSGLRGYAQWLELYDAALQGAIQVVLVGSGSTAREKLEEYNQITEIETKALEKLESAWAQTDAERAFAVWVKSYDSYLDQATASSGPDSRTINDSESRVLDRVAGLAPGVSDKTAHLQWFQLYLERYRSATKPATPDISAEEAAELERLTAVKPQGVGAKPYRAWLPEFKGVLGGAIDGAGAFSKHGQQQLTLFLASKPCGDSDDIQEAWAPIPEILDRVKPEVRELATTAQPEACE